MMSEIFKLPLSVEASRPESGGDGHCYLLGGKGQLVSTEDKKELEAICEAVNSHDKLLTENKRLKTLLKEIRRQIAIADDRGSIIAKIDCFTDCVSNPNKQQP